MLCTYLFPFIFICHSNQITELKLYCHPMFVSYHFHRVVLLCIEIVYYVYYSTIYIQLNKLSLFLKYILSTSMIYQFTKKKKFFCYIPILRHGHTIFTCTKGYSCLIEVGLCNFNYMPFMSYNILDYTTNSG